MRSHGYAYDYDDMYGKDGTLVGLYSKNPSYRVIVNYP